MPVDLGWELLTFATAPDRAEDRAVVAQWAEPFDVSGWPEPWGRHEPPRRARFPRLWPALAAAACVVVVVAVAFVWLPRSSGGSSVGAAPAVPDVSDSATVAPSESAAVDSPEPTPTVSTSSPAAVPTPTPPRPRPRPSTTRPTTKPPTAGTLSISQGSPDLGETGTFLSMTLTAVNGPVTWSASPGPGLSVSGGKRSLAKDESTTVTVTLTRPATCGTDDKGSSSVTFSPGGKTGTVVWTCPPTPSP
jgi:hypothetical protein